jgi:hypothetical protein
MSEEQALQDAAALLRAAGWTVMPPASENIPEPKPGDVWVSPSATVKPRTVLEITSRYGRAIRYKIRVYGGWTTRSCERGGWAAWARVTGARPAA